ncbi:hypothetical protein AQUCO_00700840v1 [Aquilegia coerulea]|uniref:KIB1-4 beta-propeller domain-containing protein n=1 Tax=Aquilegia coerulea TaxID=218851 RepID=A0A2G5ELV7_AQUCA|nr:hypothetical protein AQUCO_00700840v1 [Aquilegia coerulea]
MEEVPWSQLPPELLEIISTKLTIYRDYLRFRAVCVSWRSNLPIRPRHQFPCQLPWLMLPSSNLHTGNINNIRAFFNLSDKNFHRLELPEARFRRCCGSSYGWLVLLEESPMMYLLNLLTRQQFQLPSLTTFPNVIDFNVSKVGKEYVLVNQINGDNYTRNLKEMRNVFIQKVVLSSSPLDGDFIVVAILNETGELAFFKNGSNCWSMIDGARNYAEDVVYYNGLFYAVSRRGAVAVLDLGGDFPAVVTVIPPTPLCGGDILYLVVSYGELFLVNRYLNLEDDIEPNLIYVTVGFSVFKLDTSGLIWAPVESLGDRMFFLGGNSSLCLYASHYHGVKGNCIYFTDDYVEANDDGARGNHDVGVFRLDDGGIDSLLCWSGHSQLVSPPHIWVTPNPC